MVADFLLGQVRGAGREREERPPRCMRLQAACGRWRWMVTALLLIH